MKKLRFPIRLLSLSRRVLGLNALEMMEIETIKKRLIPILATRKILAIRGALYAPNVSKCDTVIKLLSQIYLKLAFYDDSEITSRHHRRNIRLTDYLESDLHILFRFRTHNQLERLITCLDMPQLVKLDNNVLVTNVEIVLVSLYKLAFPTTNEKVGRFFGMESTLCSRIFNFFIRYLVENWGYLLLDNLSYWLSSFPMFAERIEQKMIRLGLHDNHSQHSKIFSFIDCTTFETCTPSNPTIQPIFYTGYKKMHGVKFQVIVLPNGMKLHVSHPSTIRKHDSSLLRQSYVLQKLEALQEQLTTKYRMHGDPAYGNRPPFLSSGELGQVRVTVEQDFGEAKELFKYVTYFRSLQLLKMKLSLIFFSSLLLHDMYITFNGSKVGTYFGLAAPSLEEWTSQGKKKLNMNMWDEEGAQTQN